MEDEILAAKLRVTKGGSDVATRLGQNITLGKELGSGASSTVYLGWHEFLHKEVAVKVLHSNSTDVTARERFRQEAIVAKSLANSHIVQVYDFGVDPAPYIVMELVSGAMLSQVLADKGSLSVDSALPLFIQLCEALEAAHNKQLIHRDLKPSNIMVDDNLSHCKVLDFGIAKDLLSDKTVTRTGDIVGSPPYMSPEQFRGEPVDARTDVYALGCVMFEVLAGRKVFSANSPAEFLYQHSSVDAPSLSKVCPDLKLPAGLDVVIARCLAKDPRRRFQSAAELRTALGNVRDGKGGAIKQERDPSKFDAARFFSLVIPASVVLLLFLFIGVFRYKLYSEDARIGDTIAMEVSSGLWSVYPGYMAKCRQATNTPANAGGSSAVNAERLFNEARAEALAAEADWWPLLEIDTRAGEFYLARDRYNEARAAFERALQDLGPRKNMLRYGHVQLLLSTVESSLGNNAKALGHAQAAVAALESGVDSQRNPCIGEAYFMMALCAADLGLWADATQSLQKALVLLPKNSTAADRVRLCTLDIITIQCAIGLKQKELASQALKEVFVGAESTANADLVRHATEVVVQYLRSFDFDEQGVARLSAENKWPAIVGETFKSTMNQPSGKKSPQQGK